MTINNDFIKAMKELQSIVKEARLLPSLLIHRKHGRRTKKTS